MVMSNKQRSNRQYATLMTRKYLGGEMSQYQLFDSFSDFTDDPLLKELYDKIRNQPKKKGIFHASKESNERYLSDILNLLDELDC